LLRKVTEICQESQLAVTDLPRVGPSWLCSHGTMIESERDWIRDTFYGTASVTALDVLISCRSGYRNDTKYYLACRLLPADLEFTVPGYGWVCTGRLVFGGWLTERGCELWATTERKLIEVLKLYEKNELHGKEDKLHVRVREG